jgi:polyisoprenoid-binding protein YceI
MSTSTPKPSDRHAIERTRWRIDPARSSVEFHSPTFWGLMTVKGHFEHYEGTLDLQRTPAIELTIEAGSLNTNNKMRDKHLRSNEFFDVTDHPHVRFISDNATLHGERLKVSGLLYAAGQSIPLTLDAELRRVGDELDIYAKTDADHRKLGMTHGMLGMIRTPSQLTVRGRLIQTAE